MYDGDEVNTLIAISTLLSRNEWFHASASLIN